LWHKFDTNSPHVIHADDLTANYGTHDCRQLRQHIFSDLSPIAVDLALHYAKTAERYDYDHANQELLKIHERLRIGDLNLCAGTEELKNAAKVCAEKCRSAQRTGEPWKNDQAIRKIIWMPALNRAGLKYRNPYQTRHIFASTLLSRGENPLWVAQQMGHKDWGQIRKVYGRWIPQLN